MNLQYRIATVSFCPDLTDPDARSYKVGALLIGECDNVRIAAVATQLVAPFKVDPVGREILENLSTFLRAQVELAAVSMANAPISDVFRRMHDALRNTVHISSVTESLELQWQSVDDLQIKAIGAALRDLHGGPVEVVDVTEDESPAGRHIHRQIPTYFPETAAWPLPAKLSQSVSCNA